MTQVAAIPVGMVPRVSFTARRFQLPDFNDMGRIWLLDRLAGRWKHWQPPHLLGWLRGVVGQDEYFFIRTDHAAGLAQVIMDRLYPAPVVKEIFVVCHDRKIPEHVAEAISIYQDICRWAKTLGACEVQISQVIFQEDPERWGINVTDAPKDQVLALLKEQFGDNRVIKRETMVAMPVLK